MGSRSSDHRPRFPSGRPTRWSSPHKDHRGRGADQNSSWYHRASGPTTSRFSSSSSSSHVEGDWNHRNYGRHHPPSSNASNSWRNNESSSKNDKPFTIIKPPGEGCNFTIVTNTNNDFNSFSGPGHANSRRHLDIYSQLSLRESNYFAFGSKTSSDVLKMCFLYAVARMIYERKTDETLIPAIAAAEFAADYLPHNRRLFGEEADNYFENVMGMAVRDPNFILKVRPNQRLYETLESYGLPRVYPTVGPVQLDGQQYMRILQVLSMSLDPAYVDCDLCISLTAIAPCLQLDCVTVTFLRRLQRTVREELGKEVRVDKRSTAVFYEQYLSAASENEVEEMLVYWRSTIPDAAKQLKALLKRLPGNGLLPITLIGRALAECDDFPWHETFGMYPDDWKAVDEAICLINNDPFYGYRRDKSELTHPKHYQNLAWLAWHLCVAKLEDDYPDMNHLVKEPARAEDAKRLVAMYVAHSQRDGVAMDQS